jgi:anti-anti-sigma factor
MELNLPGELTISHVAEIKDAMVKALDEDGDLVLVTEQVTEIDVAGLQLLCSAVCTARERQVALRVAGGSPSSTICEAMEAAGLAEFTGSSTGCRGKEVLDG